MVLVTAVAMMPVGALAADPPTVVRPVDDITLTVGTGPHWIDLRGVYYGELERCIAVSSDEGIATVVIVEGYDMYVDPVGVGQAEIDITAINAYGSVDHGFTVTVNHVPPEAVGQFPELELRVGDVFPLDASAGFNGEALSYTAVSSDESAATASIEGSTASITALAKGSTYITITATNTGGSATHTFGVWVLDVPPMAVGEIEPVEMRVGDDPAMIDVVDAFSGSALQFSAASSNEYIATVNLSGTTVSIEGHVAGMTVVTVTATNSEGSADQVIMVHVRDVPPMAVGDIEAVEMRIGDDAVMIDVAEAFSGTGLEFSAASSDENIATVSLSGTTLSIQVHLAGMATVTVTATNTEGSAEQTIKVNSRDVPPMAVGELPDVTIRVGDDAVTVDVTEAFSGTALSFSVASSAEGFADVSISGAVVTIKSIAAGTTMVTATATNTEGSADQVFTVTIEDVPPSVASALPDVHLIAGGEHVLVDVTGSFGGTALVYSASVSGDSVSVTQAGGHVTLAPLVEGLSTVSVTASNSAGQLTQSFTASVSTDAAESDALENTVAAVARSTLASITSAFSTRFRAERMGNTGGSSASAFAAEGLNPYDPFAPPGMPAAAPFSNWMPFDSPQSAGSTGAWTQGHGMAGTSGGLRQLAGRSFVIPLNAAGSGSGSWTAPAEWTFWGHVDRQSFDGSDYDGDLVSLYIGADAKFGDNWLAGVAISRSSGDADYEFTSAMASGTGEVETDMVSVLPYVHFAIDDKAELWAATGFGWGDIELKRSATAQESKADLSMWMIAAGGRRILASGADWNFGLTGDAGVLQMEADDGVGLIEGMDVSVGRVKIAFEGERIISTEGGNVFSIFGQVGGRHDSGDGETGSGVELMGGVRYDTEGRIRLEAKARLLSLHSAGGYEENGVSISAMVRPRSDGSGMSLALSSYLGTGMNGTNQSLEQGYGYPGSVENFGFERDTWGMDAQFGYTLRVQRLAGLVTPFARFDMAGSDGHGMQMGLRYDLANPGEGTLLNLEISGGQEYDRFRRETNNMMQLRGELRF